MHLHHRLHRFFDRCRQRRQERMVNRLTRQLNLTEPQQARLRLLKTELGKMRDGVLLFRTGQLANTGVLIAASRFDREQAAQLLRTGMHALEQKLEGIMQTSAGFYDSLSEPQQQQLRVLWSERQARACGGWH